MQILNFRKWDYFSLKALLIFPTYFADCHSCRICLLFIQSSAAAPITHELVWILTKISALRSSLHSRPGNVPWGSRECRIHCCRHHFWCCVTHWTLTHQLPPQSGLTPKYFGGRRNTVFLFNLSLQLHRLLANCKSCTVLEIITKQIK